MMLDCDTILLTKAFDEDLSTNLEQTSGNMNEWTGSDLEKRLNGTDYYDNTSVFTSGEKSVILQTALTASDADYVVDNWNYKDYAANDYVYLLSAKEANELYADNAARVKTILRELVSYLIRPFFDLFSESFESISIGSSCHCYFVLYFVPRFSFP